MNTNQNQSRTIFDPQIKLLMSIRHFDDDLGRYIFQIQNATQTLIQSYENGLRILERNADNEHHQEWEDLLNQNRVNVNQLNQTLKLAQDKIRTQEEKDTTQDWKDYENKLKDLKQSAHKFELLGVKYLNGADLMNWESEVAVFDKEIEPKIVQNAKAIHLIFHFTNQYSNENLNRINQIVNKYVPENTENIQPKELENSYLKAVREFQREFQPQNLWDAFLEILAGGVHPSPEERVSLMNQLEGEEKTKKDL